LRVTASSFASAVARPQRATAAASRRSVRPRSANAGSWASSPHDESRT
jgi:hypothetical protein